MPNLLAPSDLFDQGRTLFGMLGTFWTGFYQGAQVVYDIMRSRSELTLQTKQDIEECIAAVGRYQIPVFHRERWMPLALLKSQQLTDLRLTYSSVDNLGPSSTTTLSNRTYDFTLPTGVVDVAMVVDLINNPNITWVKDVDYILDSTRNAIRFLNNPFTYPNVLSTPVYGANNAVVDQALTLWLAEADLDTQLIATQFGYVTKLMLASSTNYQNLLNSVWDGDVIGPTKGQLYRAMAAICDAPIAQSTGEIVQAIVQEPDRLLIITNAAVYVAGSAANAVVSVGQVLNQYDVLTDAFSIIDLSQGTPSAGVLGSITVPTNMLQGAFSGGLTFTNAFTPTVVTTVGGRTQITFALGGAGGDVTLFFTTALANGILPGKKTLAQLLDLRPQPQSTDPDVNSLPSMINPMDFLVKNIFRYGVQVIQTKAASFGPNALGTSLLPRILLTLIPPQGYALTILG